MILKYILFSLLIFLLFCECNSSDSSVKRDAVIDKVYSSFDTTHIVYSNELNSNYFTTGSLEVKQIEIKNIDHENNNGYSKNIWTYNYSFPITSVFYAGFESNKTRLPFDYIVLNKKKYYYDSIYHKNKTKLISESDPIRAEIDKVYELTTKSNIKYLAFFIKNTFYNDYHSDELVFLFSISNEEVTNVICVGYTKFISTKLFGDYNKNGKLDFLFVTKNMDTIKCKEINDGEISDIKDKYIIVKSPDGMGETFFIDSIRTKWWVALKEK